MSLYRTEVLNGTLITTKRHWLFWWRWTYHHCLEDPLRHARNELASLNRRQRELRALIPQIEKKIDDRKKEVYERGGHLSPYRDRWMPRVPAAITYEGKHTPKSNKKKGPPPQGATVAEIKLNPHMFTPRQPNGGIH